LRWSHIRRASFAPLLEAGTLISVLIVTGGVLLFAELMKMVGDEPHAFDRAVLLAFRSPTDVSDPVGPSWLELVFLEITSLGGAIVLSLMTAAVIGFLLVDENRAAAVLVFASVGGGALLSILLKFKIDRARPDLVPHLAEVHRASFSERPRHAIRYSLADSWRSLVARRRSPPVLRFTF